MINWVPRIVRIILVAASVFTQASGAQSMIAAGKFKEATAALEKITVQRLEQNMKEGLSPAAAVRELNTYYKAPRDQAYLKTQLATITKPDQPYKFRAFEKIKQGYRVTADDGRVHTLTYDAKAQRAAVDGHALPKYGTDAQNYLTALQKHLGPGKSAAFHWLNLFAGEAAHASAGRTIQEGLAAALIAFLIIGAAYVFTNAKDETGKPLGATKLSVTDYIDQQTEVCKQEWNTRTKFADSQTNKFLQLMAEQNVMSVDTAAFVDECQLAADRLYAQNEVAPGTKTPIERGNLTDACNAAARFRVCVVNYREREARIYPKKPAANPAVPTKGADEASH